MNAIIKSLCLIVVTFLLAVLSAFMFSCLWGWYVTPAFGFAVPSLYAVYGLALTISFVTYQYEYKERNEKPFADVIKNAVAISVSRSIVFLALVGSCKRYSVNLIREMYETRRN